MQNITSLIYHFRVSLRWFKRVRDHTKSVPTVFVLSLSIHVVYYEEIKREVKRILIYECRCNARLKAKAEGSTRLAYTG